MNNKIEILAPCGSEASFRAAINAGADAVYLAGKSFGARAYAENFSDDDLCRAIEKAHLKGVKVYLTVNTLFKNAEIKELRSYLRPFYECGLDAVIVQDPGVLSIIREEFKGLLIHASTQMNICSSKGAALLKKLGADRVIPARELTLAEIKSIKEKVDTEIEVFVHGAMCYCYSGRCLFSSMAGDRSGNRGRCAQPCRRRYNGSYLMSMKDMCALPFVPALIDAGVDSLKIEGRMKGDYYTAAVVDAYKQMSDDHYSGCFSMKKCEKYIERLSETFSRGGFCNGYFDKEELPYMIDSSAPGHRGVLVGKTVSAGHGKVKIQVTKDIGVRDILTIDAGKSSNIEITSNSFIRSGSIAEFNAAGSRGIASGTNVYRKINQSLLDEISEKLIDNEKLIPVDVCIRVKNGNRLYLSLSRGDKKAEVFGSEVLPAEKRAVSDKDIIDKMRGLGDSGYVINSLSIDNDDHSFVNFSEIKKLRREAAEILEKLILDEYRRDMPEYMGEGKDSSVESSAEADGKKHTEEESGQDNRRKRSMYVSLDNPDVCNELKKVLDGSDGSVFGENDVIFGLRADMFTGNILCEQTRYLSNFGKISIELPFINREEDERYYSDKYKEILSIKYDHIFIRNIDDLSDIILNDEASKIVSGKSVILAHSLYAYNDRAIRFYEDMLKPLCSEVIFEMPHELTLDECGRLMYSESAGVFLNVYGKEELMITAQEYDRKSKGFIKDERFGAYRYLKSRDLCYNTLIDSVPVMLDPARHSLNNGRTLPERISGFKISLHDEKAEIISEILQYYKLILDNMNDSGLINPDTLKIFGKPDLKSSEGHMIKPIL